MTSSSPHAHTDGSTDDLGGVDSCPFNADWMLDSVAVPTVDAPPEKSSTDKAGDALGSAAQQVGGGLFDALWLPLTLVGAGLLVCFVSVRGIVSASRDAEAA